MELISKTNGHGLSSERYAVRGHYVIINIAVSKMLDRSLQECHYQVIRADGSTSGILYSRDAAMRIAEE